MKIFEKKRAELQIGNIRLQGPLMLAPMAGYTNLPFRICLRKLGGVALATTDLVNARSILELNPKAMRLIATCAEDWPLGVQIFGGKAHELRDAARFLEDLDVRLIDINMGCPAPKVNKSGGGAALMRDEELSEKFVRVIVEAVKIPVTVKMRLGWDEKNINAHVIAPRLEQMGVAAVAVHGRTRAQGYRGKVNLEGIRVVVDAVKKIPVIGNGDIRSPWDAKRMMNETGCAGVMIGRAAVKDPFLFPRTAHFLQTGEELPPTTLEERLQFMHEHFFTAVKLTGEKNACLQFRKVVINYSQFFPEKKKWRGYAGNLSSVEDYVKMIEKLCPSSVLDFSIKK